MLGHLGDIEWSSGHFRAGRSLYEEALQEPAINPSLASYLHEELFWVAHNLGDFPLADSHARSALELAENGGEPRALVSALAATIHADVIMGRRPDPERIERTLRLEATIDDLQIWESASWVFTDEFVWMGDHQRARRLCEDHRAAAAERGHEALLAQILFWLAEVELREGDWERAYRYAGQVRDLELRFGMEWAETLTQQAFAEAALGNVDMARGFANEALAQAEGLEQHKGMMKSLESLGALELSLGRPEEALRHLRPASEMLFGDGVGEPAVFLFLPDEVESLVAVGEIDEAEPLVAWLEERGQTLDRPYALATGARCRGLIEAARGDLPSALASLDEALKHHEHLPMPFELGRTLLVQGAIRRRAKQKRPARPMG